MLNTWEPEGAGREPGEELARGSREEPGEGREHFAGRRWEELGES